MRLLSVVEGICNGREDLRGGGVKKIIEELNVIHRLGGFNQSQAREILQGFWYKIMNNIGGDRGGSRRCVEEGEFNLGFLLRR